MLKVHGDALKVHGGALRVHGGATKQAFFSVLWILKVHGGALKVHGGAQGSSCLRDYGEYGLLVLKITGESLDVAPGLTGYVILTPGICVAR